MKKLITSSFLLFLLTYSNINAAENKAHVHGLAYGNIIINGPTLNIELNIPAESIVGFEHKAVSDQELKEIDQAKVKFKNPNLFTFYEMKRLRDKKLNPVTASVEIEIDSDHSISETSKDKLHSDHNHQHHDKHNAHHTEHHDNHKDNDSNKKLVHSEFKINYIYLFEESDKSIRIETNLFEQFPNIEQLILSIISETKQKEVKLNKKSTEFNI